MTKPYNKHDIIAGRDLTAGERLESARATLKWAVRLLEQFSDDTVHTSDKLTEDQLLTICKAVDQAYLAAENAAFLGRSGFVAHALQRVEWGN